MKTVGRSILRPILAPALAATLALALLPAVASAHIHATIGKFATVVGWLDEPAVQGQMNGLDVTVLTSPGAQPVTGLEKTLKAQVGFAGQTETLSLTPQENKPGHYTAPIVPSQPGDYQVRLFGLVDGTSFDHTYDLGSDPDMVVQALSGYAFPKGTRTTSMPPAAPAAASSGPAAVPASGLPAAAPTTSAAPAWAVWLALVLGALGLVTGGLALGRRSHS